MTSNLLLSALAAVRFMAGDADGDGWSDYEESVARTSAANPKIHPEPTRYAVVDLGRVDQHGWPISLSEEGHRVLTNSGATWSWEGGWVAPAPLAQGEQAYYWLINAQGEVAAKIDTRTETEARSELVVLSGVYRRFIPGTRTVQPLGYMPGYNFGYSGSDQQRWHFYPARWVRSGALLIWAQPVSTTFDGPTGGDVVLATEVGVVTPERTWLSGEVVSDSAGARWLGTTDGAWMPVGLEPLGPLEIPLARGDEGTTLARDHEGAFIQYAQGHRQRLPDSADLRAATFSDLEGVVPDIVEIGPPGRLWRQKSDGTYASPVSLGRTLPAVEGLTSLHVMTGDLSGTLLAVGRRHEGPLRGLLLIPCQVRADLLRATDTEGRRRPFELTSASYATAARPLLLWHNDDRDEGFANDDSRHDLPGAPVEHADFSQPAPRGKSDLVDWFPVSICLGRVAESLPAFEVRLTGAGASLVNALETDLPHVRANQIYQNDFSAVYGPSRSDFVGALKAERYPWGLNLSSGFADCMVGPRLLGRGEGVVLLEGRAVGVGPLWFNLVHRGTSKNRDPLPEEILFKIELSLAVAPVEDFYRAVDARETNLRQPTRPRAEFPKLPHELPWVVFIHGFNVDAEAGRAWGAEIFRRLHQSGSSSPFVSFRWYGDQGATNYAMSVECAPAAATRLAALVVNLGREQPGRPVVFVGHSLGAYVALLASERLAATRGSPTVRACVLVNGAVPAEALDGQAPWKVADYTRGREQVMATLMRAPETDWASHPQLSDPATWSARWATAFPVGDLRRGCTWANRFPQRPPVLNLYARTEDVLSPPAADSAHHPGLFDVATDGAWIFQEWRKGRLASSLASPTRAQAGWGYARDVQRRLRRHAAASGEAQLHLRRTEPLFASFRDAALVHPAVGVHAPGSISVARTLHATSGWGSRVLPAGAQWTVRDELLAHAIPALSGPIGSAPVAGCLNYRMDGQGDFDLPQTGLTAFPLGWPRGLEAGNHLEVPTQVWRHSDWCRIAYPYVYPAYAFIVKETQLAFSTP